VSEPQQCHMVGVAGGYNVLEFCGPSLHAVRVWSHRSFCRIAPGRECMRANTRTHINLKVTKVLLTESYRKILLTQRNRSRRKGYVSLVLLSDDFIYTDRVEINVLAAESSVSTQCSCYCCYMPLNLHGSVDFCKRLRCS